MKDKKLDALQATAIFGSCSKKQLKEIGRVTEGVTMPGGTVVMKESASPDRMVILIEGAAVVEVGDTKLAELGAGDVIGELGMIDDNPASATVTITEDSKAWLIERRFFASVMEDNPELSLSLLKAVVSRLRATNALLT